MYLSYFVSLWNRFVIKKAVCTNTSTSSTTASTSNAIATPTRLSSSTSSSTDDEDYENSREPDSDFENVVCTETPTRNSKKRYKQHFKEEWRKYFKWAKGRKDGSTVCVVCQIIITGSKTHLKRHADSKSHKKRFRAAQQTPSITKVLNQSSEKKDLVKETELKIVTFLGEHNLPSLYFYNAEKQITI